MNQLNSSTIAWRRMLISIYNRFSFLRFASFFLCIREVLLEDATARFIDRPPTSSLSLSLSDEKTTNSRKKTTWSEMKVSTFIFPPLEAFEIPLSTLTLICPFLSFPLLLPSAIKLHPRIGLHRSKKPRSSLEFSNRRGVGQNLNTYDGKRYLFSYSLFNTGWFSSNN